MKKLFACILTLALVLPGCAALAEAFFPLAEPVTFSFAITQSNNVTDYYDNYFTQWLEEKTGVKLDFVLFPSTDAATKLNLMVASGDVLPDILTFGISANTAYEWGSMGLLIPMNDYYAEHGQIFYAFCESLGLDGDRDVLSQVISLDGNIYAAPYYSYSYNNSTALRSFINQDWLVALNLGLPTTSDELIEVLTAFRDKDPNGNGLADEIPMLGRGDAPLGYLQNMFIYNSGYGEFLPLSQTSGVLDVCYDKQAYRDFLIYVNGLVKEGLLSPLTFTIDATQFTSLQVADPAQIGIVTDSPVALANSPDLYVAFETLTGPEGVQQFTIYPPTASPRIAVTRYCKNPEIAIRFINFQFEEGGSDLAMIQRYGEQDVDWRLFDPAIDTDRVGSIPGMNPYLVQLQTQWGVPSNKLWQVQVFGYVSNPAWWVAAVDPVADVKIANYTMGQNYALNVVHGPSFGDLVTANSFAFTEEEDDLWLDARNALDTYIEESRALFALGEMNPADDDTWQKYLAELDKLQYRQILEVYNTAYARKLELMK